MTTLKLEFPVQASGSRLREVTGRALLGEDRKTTEPMDSRLITCVDMTGVLNFPASGSCMDDPVGRRGKTWHAGPTIM